MPALARYNRAHLRRIHEKSCNCVLTNTRTGLDSKAYEGDLVRPYIDTNLDLHVVMEVFADDDWQEGDFFTISYPSRPGWVSTKRRVKFIQTREDGIPLLRIVVQGTTDRK